MKEIVKHEASATDHGGVNRRQTGTPTWCTPTPTQICIEVDTNETTTLEIQGVSDDGPGVLDDTYKRSVTFIDGVSQGSKDNPNTELNEGEYVEFTLKSMTPQRICKTRESFRWIYTSSTDEDVEFDRTDHDIYLLWDEPKNPWVPNGNSQKNAWVKALDFAIGTAGGQSSNPSQALGAITGYLHTGHGLHYNVMAGAPKYCDDFGPSGVGDFLLTAYIDKREGYFVNCYDQAAAVCILGRVIGLPVQYLYMAPFGYIQIRNIVGVGPCNNPTYPRSAYPENPIAPEDALDRSRFTNHAFSCLANPIYDACAGPILGYPDLTTYFYHVVDTSVPGERTKEVLGKIKDVRLGIVGDFF